jgi:hypothetical protein
MRPSAGAIDVLEAVQGRLGTLSSLALPLAALPVFSTLPPIALEPHPTPNVRVLVKTMEKK